MVRKCLLNFASLGLLLTLTAAPITQASDYDSLDRLIAEADLGYEYQSTAEAIVRPYWQGPPEQGRVELLNAVTNTAHRVFAHDKLAKKLRAELAERLSAGDIKAVLHFYAQSSSKRIRLLEKAAAVPDGRDRLDQHEPALRKRLANDRPLADLLHRLERALRYRERAIQSVHTIQRAVLTGMNTVYGHRTQAEMDAHLAAMLPALELEVEMVSRLGFAMTYGDAHPEDLQAFVEFAESTLGRRYFDAVSVASARVLVSASLEFGRDISMLMRAPKL